MAFSQLINLAGLVFCAVTLIVLGDTAGKLMTSQGIAPVFVAWTRFFIAALLFLPFSGLRLPELRMLSDWRVIARAAILSCAICSILTALRTEPIANVFGAFFIGPMVSFVLAAVFLKEKVTVARTALVFFGFIGVVLVVKPGFGATIGTGYAVLAGALYGGYLVFTRMTAPDHRPRLLLLSHLVLGAIFLAPPAIISPWPVLDVKTNLLILGSALGSALGNYFLVVANRRFDASLIAPLIYTQLISATVVGVIVFGDWPDLISVAGLCVILASGLATLWLVRHPQ